MLILRRNLEVESISQHKPRRARELVRVTGSIDPAEGHGPGSFELITDDSELAAIFDTPTLGFGGKYSLILKERDHPTKKMLLDDPDGALPGKTLDVVRRMTMERTEVRGPADDLRLMKCTATFQTWGRHGLSKESIHLPPRYYEVVLPISEAEHESLLKSVSADFNLSLSLLFFALAS